MQVFTSSQTNPEQPIEIGEVVHVGMGDEQMAYAQQLARRQRAQITQVEQQSPVLEQKVEIQNGIFEWIVD